MSINTYLSDRALAFAGEYELEACKAARKDLDALDAEDARDRIESEYYRESQNDARRVAFWSGLTLLAKNVEAMAKSLAEEEEDAE